MPTEKNIAESAIAEGWFQSVFEHAPIAIVLVNDELQVLMANKQFTEMTGYTDDDLPDISLKSITYPADYKNNLDQYQKLYRNEIDSFTITKRYIKKDKGLLWVKVTVSANPNKATSIAMVQDITAEKSATSELVKSEYKYRTLIENANDGIGLFDAAFKPVIHNAVLYEALGYNLEEYLQINHGKFELFHPDDIPAVKEAFEKVMQGVKSRIEKRMLDKEGNIRYFSVSYIPVMHEEEPAFMIFRREITKRVQAEQQKEEYRSFLETLMDHLPVSLFAKTTPDFRYLYWNKTLEEYTGISAEEAIGCNDFELPQFRRQAQNTQEEDKKLLRNKERIEEEQEFVNSRGELKRLQSIRTLVKTGVGNPLILGISMDVSELRRAEVKIEQSSQMLKEAQKIAKLGYWEYDVSKDLLFDNPENRQILGTQDLDYFLNLNQLLDRLHYTSEETILEGLNSCINEGLAGESVIKLELKGKMKYLALNYKPVFDKDEKVGKVRGTTIDITRIKSSELALQESEHKLKQAEHFAKVGYWNQDFETGETEYSDEVWNILSLPFPQEPLPFEELFENVHPDDKAGLVEALVSSKEKHAPFDVDFRVIAFQKVKYIRASGTYVVNKDKLPVRSIGVFQDVSAVREKELELEHLTHHLNEVEKLSKTGFMDLQLESGEFMISDSFWDIVELPKGSIASFDDFARLIHPGDRKTIVTTLKTTLKDEGKHNIQYRLKLKNGLVKYVNEICVVGEHSHPLGKYATRILQDITQMKEQQQLLLRSNMRKWDHFAVESLGTWEYHAEDDVVLMSEEMLNILGIERQEKPRTITDLMPLVVEEDRYSVQTMIRASIARQENYTLTFRTYSPKAASEKRVQLVTRFYHSPAGERMAAGYVRDLSEKEEKAKISETWEVLHSVMDNYLVGIYLIQDMRFVFSNKKGCMLLGCNHHIMMEKVHLSDVLEKENYEKIAQLMQKWDAYELKDYVNFLHINPVKSEQFYAEMFIKEVISNGERAFLVMLYDQK